MNFQIVRLSKISSSPAQRSSSHLLRWFKNGHAPHVASSEYEEQPSRPASPSSIHSESIESTCTEITIPDAFQEDSFKTQLAYSDILSENPYRPQILFSSLPAEIHLLIFDQLFNTSDACTSTCLGLTCKTFYFMHRAYFPDPVDLLASTPKVFKSSLQWNLCDLLKSWVPNGMECQILFQKGKVLFMIEEQWKARSRDECESEFRFLECY